MFSAAGKSAVTSGYNINNSLRFRNSASTYLSRTPASAGNRQIMTYSFWVKRGALTADYNLTNATTDASNSATLYFNSSNNQTFDVFLRVGATNYSVTTSQVFRDPSSWYHIVVAIDTTQATASNRTKVYVNGTQVTAFLTANYVPQNSNLALNNNVAQSIGGTSFFDGYMTEVNFIDGSQLTPSSFGQTDGASGSWVPRPYSGSYGTNGFYLPFSNTNSSGFSSFYGSFDGTTQSLSATLPATLSGQFTIEGFIRPNVVAFNPLFTLGDSLNSTGLEFYFGGGSTPTVWSNNATRISGAYDIPSNTWAHIAVTRDASNVIRLFMNGYQIGGTYTSAAAFSNTLRIGAEFYSGSITGRMDGFISNFRIVTGSALYTSNFTPPTSALTAITGTQILTLQNATIIDNSTNALTITNTGSVATTSATVATYSRLFFDLSGNNNNWFPNNINYTTAGTTYDAMTDVPTLTSATVANYPTLNPLSNTSTLTEANLSASNILLSGSTIATPSSGKWYFEYTQTTSIPSGSLWVGVSSNLNAIPDNQLQGYSYATDGRKVAYNSYTSGYGATWTNGDIIGCALDLDSATITFYKNNVSQGVAFTGITIQPYVFALSAGGAPSTKGGSINFGQRPFSYTPPTGFVALNTYNLPDSTIVKGSSYMNVATYTGSSSNVTVTSGFYPDFAWAKSRNNTYNHSLFDSVRGGDNVIFSNLTNAESTTSGLATFSSTGVTWLAGAGGINADASTTYVNWFWNAGSGTTTVNTSGSISSNVSVNATAGFSVVTYTGTGSVATVGHGLGVAPKMVIVKNRSVSSAWRVWFTGFAGTEQLNLNETAAKETGQITWNSTVPSSTVFSLGTPAAVNGNGNSLVAYLWSEIAGFSAFGSYTGNGSADGPFVYTGFRPKFVLIKRTVNAGGSWAIYDSSRNTYNVANLSLYPNLTSADDTYDVLDFTSNGFKIRTSALGVNQSADTFIYASFAENPFKNALAR